ncbi:MAG TPA: hemerythrin domain-containing protein [Burkholderiaceae bacterium]|nr:hemerythrin domain-containing protein [Burkholderiaceae bacterium]
MTKPTRPKQFIDFRTPAAGFDQPLALWSACHERVLRMVSLLGRLVEHISTTGVDESARVTAASIRRYFDEAVPRHHEDEEVDLFPRLLASPAARDDGRIASALATLEKDHEDLGAMWPALRATLLALERGEAVRFDDVSVALFISRYRTHCEVEDEAIGPALARALDAKALAEVGRAMAKRRGVDWDDLATPAGELAQRTG